MRNLSETEVYSFSDHVLSRAIFALSRVVGVRNITRPFWNRWRAALFDQKTLDRFLAAIGGLSDWPTKGKAFLDNEIRQVETSLQNLSNAEIVTHYRRLSFLAHLVQWGCLPLSDVKTQAYKQCRDFYLEAERRAFGDRFARLRIDWEGKALWANLHLPASTLPSGKIPLIVLVHGMDDVKEEHLASELLFAEAGFAVLCIDGPGQGETFLLDGVLWPENFEAAIVSAIDALKAYPSVDTDHYAIVGISWGGMWAYKIAAADPRVSAILDLGGPIDSREFNKLPFFLKSKFCQILGVASTDDVDSTARIFTIRDQAMLKKVAARVHIVHGDRDPIVSTADKAWLRDTLQQIAQTGEVKLTVYRDGDHCCTQHVKEVRTLASAEFLDEYLKRTRALRSGDTAHSPVPQSVE
ncbi:alpha/beta hydrolase family protein [Paraburkholderia bryophila]|uniref:Prolyl oligopeptidase family protein n=1 Tax=Paraburkholderia bryophila TaxID=420952 RepID=A0A329B916_9BURK|nr:alpha/beta fold hydrolase [Paraburkholderia bryophila]RAS15786.1 prolyl oligopeptidase family protein [Paraburkholderia bryophila]